MFLNICFVGKSFECSREFNWNFRDYPNRFRIKLRNFGENATEFDSLIMDLDTPR